MRLKTRFVIAIMAVLIGFITISGLVAYLVVGVNRLNTADKICNDTMNTLKHLQINTSDLLTTYELDNTFSKWKSTYQRFQREIDTLNNSPAIHYLLATKEKEGILESMNTFWNFTLLKISMIDKDITNLFAGTHQSRDGLIFQYAESKDYQILAMRNNIYNALGFLEAEFETKLDVLIAIVEQEKSMQFADLIYHVSFIGLIIAVLVSTIFIRFLVQLKSYLDNLHNTMEIIGKGDFTKKLDIPGDDELSQIANAINTTTDNLKDMHEELERRISEREQINKSLRKSEEKFRIAFKTNPNAITLTSIEDGIYADINDGFTRLLGYSREDIIEKSSLALSIWNDSKDRERLVAGLKKDGLVENLEAEFKGKDGQVINGLMSASILDIEEKKYLLAITQDITELKQSESERLNLEIRLQQAQKMESIGTLSGGIAHDFNNILSGIFGYSQLAQINRHSPEKVNKNIDQILKGAKRAAELVQQILTFSRKTEYQKGSFRIYQQVNEALRLLRSTIPSTIEIKSELDSRSMILADPVKIHQVIMNLCTNAYHAMRETGGRLKVSLKDVTISEPKQLKNKNIFPGNYLKLEVNDTGHGMDEKTIEKAFDPYYTTKETGEGTGLGLAIVQAIVDEHDGYFEIFSTPGKGTNFYIYFPIVMEKIEISDLKFKKPPPLKGNDKIMFVDDEDPIRQTAKNIIERYGYKVSLFRNGIEAQKEFEKHPDQFDLVITDMNMPEMAGDKLVVELKKIRPDIPIIICTGFSDTMTKEKAASISISGFLMKPIVMKNLVQKIREVLDKKRPINI